MKKILVILTICLLFVSCGSKQAVITTEKKVTDSTFVEKSVTKREVAVVVPSSRSEIRVPVKNLTNEPKIKKQGQATVSLHKEQEDIIATADCEELELKIQVQDSLIKSLRTIIKETAYHTPRDDTGNWFDRILKNTGLIFLVLLALFAIFIIIKNYLLK